MYVLKKNVFVLSVSIYDNKPLIVSIKNDLCRANFVPMVLYLKN